MKGFTPRNVTIQVTHLNVPKTQLARADKMQQRKLKALSIPRKLIMASLTTKKSLLTQGQGQSGLI